jgi:hypothetical protein
MQSGFFQNRPFSKGLLSSSLLEGMPLSENGCAIVVVVFVPLMRFSAVVYI